ncbi:MAG: hypothetical protein O0X93_08595 [Methanocorpusculum sp.]|uniref:Uncharacterized protein n=1 Tax=Methanocorpusculum petauri TaxID=3002863 RepID=A0ABT4IGH7_9EURY|nr:hypothetical protein [Methanocorpusculum petauri]MCZ9312578.1 hypothetical protein [Methanocorpusculum sp.]MCZ0860845.1 hypothetical protein [Methanocorpusculum petauri]MDE2444508.1 hypothetical protein [Methanocorpusculum sp.]MDE2518657.1 hypothetical protein [Methanocorpusculum sp.]MDE2523197.1 hypothetical protein [Methanocorpusculum sp.]
MRIKFNDIDEGSDTGAGVDGRKAKSGSAKISGSEDQKKKKGFASHVTVIEGEGLPGEADRT